ncbi:imidazole glycerol phosphate synthase subunit HisH [Collinsella tanakaei]|uniref:Imidazole glycerol phosphate synthase subunit HisH n=1 Tax=Collinsella tanakaei YIT 12063 TaxID=742742 RepID=G1WI40_9ACTN|nr:imidazole glycerol phosphate synthase subunit HisH [Collinsella tanakaei]EGX71615.1 imidazole glycerol phosphate synthase [Collinsella tanakaei YIT 12063]
MDAPRIAVVDYHKGNLSSVVRGLARAGAAAYATDNPDEIRSAEGLVLPGVGSFYDAIAYMSESGQDRAVMDAVANGAPFLGICLGQQLLFERGDEGVPVAGDNADAAAGAAAAAVPSSDDPGWRGDGLAPGTVFEAAGRRWVRGLGLIAGSCTRLDGSRLKVPHVGWDQIHLVGAGASGSACPLFDDVAEGANVYFTHSYAADQDADPAAVAARTHYTRSFASAIWKGRVFGCQFHPEKSSAHGLQVLRNFASIVAAARDGESYMVAGCVMQGFVTRQTGDGGEVA